MHTLGALSTFAGLFILSACDPGVQISWDKQFDSKVDRDCIEKTLRSTATDVQRSVYISEGDRGIPSGVQVMQFTYSDPTGIGSYTLDVARLPNGKTDFHHEWGKFGMNISDEERKLALPLLNAVNKNISRQCNLPFAESDLKLPSDS